MLSCKQVTQICSQEMERDLQLQERVSMRMHLVMCSGCSNFRKQMQTLRTTMQQYAAGAAVSTSGDGTPEP